MKRTSKRILSLGLAALMLAAVLTPLPVQAREVLTQNITTLTGEHAYYVDAKNGDDTNDGHSPDAAWKSLEKVNSVTFVPGDHIYFKAGCTWVGHLHPHGSGTENAPIVIDMYGEGTRPHIAGNGLNDAGSTGGFSEENYTTVKTADALGNTGNAAVLLCNQEYIEINNLQVSNYCADSATLCVRRGILVQGDQADDSYLDHIYIRNCDIHDVTGPFWFGLVMHTSGGIIFQITDGQTTDEKYQTAFRDVRIENNTITNVDKMGVDFKSSWRARGGVYDGSEPGTGAWFPHQNVVIRNNVLDNIGSDGIVVAEASGALVEHNVLSRYNTIGKPAAGIWALNTDDTVFQYNEVFDGHFYQTDSQAFDIDWNNKRVIYQYNYSHNNAGGFMLLCAPGESLPETAGAFNYGGIVRYNISQNDRKAIFTMSAVGRLGEGANDGSDIDASQNQQRLPLIYNNTFYIADPYATVELIKNDGWGTSGAYGYDFYNNIVYVEDGCKANAAALINPNKIDKPVRYENNLFCGSVNFQGSNQNNDGIKNATSASGNLFADPLFVDAGGAGSGLAGGGAYKLLEGSPALGAGRVVAANGGKDYFGNPVSETAAPNIGAYNGAGLPTETTFAADNIALGKPVSASSTASGSASKYLTDGRSYTGWCAANAGYSAVEVDLNAQYSLSQIRLRMEPIAASNQSGPVVTNAQISLSISADGRSYTRILAPSALTFHTDENGAVILLCFPAQTARYIRLEFDGEEAATLFELEAYAGTFRESETAPVLRTPAEDSSVDASLRVDFSWENALDRAMSEVSIAADENFEQIVYYAQTRGTTLALPAGTLESGSYYWRVRNFNADSGDVLCTGYAVGQFRAENEQLENLARGKPATASSASTSWKPLTADKAVDGSLSWAGSLYSCWESQKSFPSWLAVDLQGVCAVRRVTIQLPTEFGSKTWRFEVQGSDDGENYTTLVAADNYTTAGGTDNSVTIALPENTRTTHLRIYYPSHPTNSATQAAQIGELLVLGTRISSDPDAPVNLASRKTATAQNFVSWTANKVTHEQKPELTVDGDLSTWWEAAKTNTYPNYLAVDLEGSYRITQVGIVLPGNYADKKNRFEIQGSSNGETYETLVAAKDYAFPSVTGNTVEDNSVKVTVTKDNAVRFLRVYYPNPESSSDCTVPQIGELIVYGTPVAGDDSVRNLRLDIGAQQGLTAYTLESGAIATLCATALPQSSSRKTTYTCTVLSGGDVLQVTVSPYSADSYLLQPISSGTAKLRITETISGVYADITIRVKKPYNYTDPYEDFSQLYAYTTGWQPERGDVDILGDADRIARVYNTTQPEQSITYHLPGISDYQLNVYSYKPQDTALDPNLSVEYSLDGSSYTAVTQEKTTVLMKSGKEWYRLTYSPADFLPENVQYLRITLRGGTAGNYWNPQLGSFLACIPGDAAVTAIPAATTPTYSGAAQALVSAGAAENGTMLYSLDAGENRTWSETIPTGTEATDYTVYYYVRGEGNYGDSAVDSVSARIAPKDIAEAVITLAPSSFVYDGDAKTQAVTAVTLAGFDSLTYDISGNVQTNAGTHTITVTGTGNFTGTARTTFSIAKATPTGKPAYRQIFDAFIRISKAELSTNGGTFSVPGSVEWVDENGESLDVNTYVRADTAYRWRFHPTDSTNYNDIFGEIVLWHYEEVNLPTADTAPAAPDEEAEREADFDDVRRRDWYCEDVRFVYENGLMNGTSRTEFGPNLPTTRGMIVTILHRLEQEPKALGANKFSDVRAGGYYAEAVLWAAENGIATGYSASEFGPEDFITREQLAAILYRYALRKGLVRQTPTADLTQFHDCGKVSGYAAEAMRWVVEQGLLQGTGGRLDPQGRATRAQVAAVLRRLLRE